MIYTCSTWERWWFLQPVHLTPCVVHMGPVLGQCLSPQYMGNAIKTFDQKHLFAMPCGAVLMNLLGIMVA